MLLVLEVRPPLGLLFLITADAQSLSFLTRASSPAAGHSDAVRALAVANERLFSGSYDGTVKVWGVSSMECLQTLAGHTGPVRTLVYSGGHMFSGSYDKTVRAGLRLCSLGSRAPLFHASAVAGVEPHGSGRPDPPSALARPRGGRAQRED